MAPVLEFPPFRLDLGDQRLWRADRPIELRPKTYAVLAHLVARAPSLVEHEELLSAVWEGVEVSPHTLNQSILELRRALGDDARNPRFIETVHRRGFRFVAPVHRGESGKAGRPAAESERHALVGRDAELEQLAEALRMAEAGHRQLVFVTGEPGIGKTSLVRAFLDGLAERDREPAPWVGVGRCVELHGEGEAYLPFLNALDHLGRAVGTTRLRSVLERFAPSWLAQLPWLLDDAAEAGSEGAGVQTTSTRMLRELCVALDELARERTLLLWLEDLHWSDLATLDLLAALARRPGPARLLVLASYRPVDAAASAHPVAALKRSLLERGECQELSLELLDERDVAAYLRGRFAWRAESPELVRAIYEQSEGNPLYMVTLTDRLAAEVDGLRAGTDESFATATEFLRALGVETLRELVEAQLDRMSAEDVEVLEAASVVGATFATQSIAAALGVEELWVEDVCSRLAGWELFVEDAGATRWPDGSTGECFVFHHDVFRRVLYDRILAARRRRLHCRIAERLAAGHGSQASALAAELAVHFERGGDGARAVDWLERAAAGVRRRYADREAVAYLERALALLLEQPSSDERSRRELDLRLELSEALMFAAGLTSPTSEKNLKRALEIAADLDDTPGMATALNALARLYWFRSDLARARGLIDRAIALEPRVEDAGLHSISHAHAARIALMRGELEGTLRSAETAWQLIAEAERPSVRHITADTGVLALATGAMIEWLQGRPERAEARSLRSVERGRSADAFRHVASLLFRGELTVCMRSIEELEQTSLEMERVQAENEFVLAYAYEHAREGARLLWHRGDAEAAIDRMERGLAETRATGVRMQTPLLLATLAEARLARGDLHAGLEAVREGLAFAEETRERYLEADLHRLRGELLLREPRIDAATQAFQQALTVARRQGARALELRAATSLARLWHQEGRKQEARELLAPVYAGFTEGIGTTDLVEAKALLDAL